MWTFKPYKDNAGEWRWRLRAGNGRIVADSGESYTQRADCIRSIERFKAQIAAAHVATPLLRAKPPQLRPPRPSVAALLDASCRDYRPPRRRPRFPRLSGTRRST